jgi:multiple sugar transport system substrate-binding protein/raffinose/stachyose/melibiose transport system substrate-binding protein
MKVIHLLLIILLLLGLSSCDKSETTHAVEHKKTVTFLHYFTDSLSGGLNEMAASFNQSSKNYSLKPISLDHEAFKSSILETLKSGHSPDLYSYWAGARTHSIANALAPIDDIWDKHFSGQFPAKLVNAASLYDGKKYLLPITQHYVGFFYNKKIFSQYGLKPPETWPQLLQLAETLKSHNIIPFALGARDKWPAQFWFDMLLLRTAPYEFRNQLMQGDASYLDPKVTQVFTLWASLLEKNYFNHDSTEISWDKGANELVYEGKAAMTLMGTWNIGYFTNSQHNWQPDVDFGFFSFPVMDTELPAVALGPIDGLVVPANAPNIAGAKAALIYLASVEPQESISKGSGSLSPNINVPRSSYNAIQLQALDAISNSQYFAFNYDLATAPEVAELGLAAFTEFLAFPASYAEIQLKLDRDVKAKFAKLRSAGR